MIKEKFFRLLKNRRFLALYLGMKVLFLAALLGCNQSPIDPDRDTIGNPTVALVISPRDSKVLTGDYKQFAVNAVDLEGKYTKVDASWSTTNGRITDKGEYVAPEAPGYALVTAKYNNVVASTQIFIESSNEIKNFYILPESGEIEVGRSVQFTCKAQNAGGDFLAVNPSWSCDVGNITNTGYYSAPGSPMYARIKAQHGRLEATANVSVYTSTPYNVVVTPQTAEVLANQTRKFSAMAYDRFGNILAFKDFKWSTTYGFISRDGEYQSPATPGVAQVYAIAGGVTGVAYVNSAPGSTATRVDISPPNAVVLIGNSVQFTATAYDSAGNIVALPAPVLWTTDNGSVSANGLYTAYPAVRGIANVSVTAGSFTKSIVLLIQ